MASLQELEYRIQQLESQISNSKEPSQLTPAQKKKMLIAVAKPPVHIDEDVDKTGEYCFGQKAGINDGNPFAFWRSTVPDPTSDSDFDVTIVSS